MRPAGAWELPCSQASRRGIYGESNPNGSGHRGCSYRPRSGPSTVLLRSPAPWCWGYGEYRPHLPERPRLRTATDTASCPTDGRGGSFLGSLWLRSVFVVPHPFTTCSFADVFFNWPFPFICLQIKLYVTTNKKQYHSFKQNRIANTRKVKG